MPSDSGLSIGEAVGCTVSIALFALAAIVIHRKSLFHEMFRFLLTLLLIQFALFEASHGAMNTITATADVHPCFNITPLHDAHFFISTAAKETSVITGWSIWWSIEFVALERAIATVTLDKYEKWHPSMAVKAVVLLFFLCITGGTYFIHMFAAKVAVYAIMGVQVVVTLPMTLLLYCFNKKKDAVGTSLSHRYQTCRFFVLLSTFSLLAYAALAALRYSIKYAPGIALLQAVFITSFEAFPVLFTVLLLCSQPVRGAALKMLLRKRAAVVLPEPTAEASGALYDAFLRQQWQIDV